VEEKMFKQYDSEFWKTVVDTMQEGLMLVDPKGRIVFVNKAFEQMVGYTNEELTGKGCDVFQCDRCFSARADGMNKYCALFKEKMVRSSECIFKTKDGESLHLLKNAAVIHDKKGKVVGGVETMIDLSRIQEKEKIIANLREQLFKAS
jgi:PAS domain S-box-containing protein